MALFNANILEPIVANKASSPCASDSHGVQSASVPTVKNYLALAGPAAVYTYSSSSQSTTTGAVAPGAAALATVDGVSIPTPNNGLIEIVGPVQARASYSCVNGGVTSESGSTVTLISVNGKKYSIIPDKETKIPLGGSSYIAVNENITTATSITERIIDVHLQGLADVVVGEAKVTQDTANPCAGTNSVPPPSLNPCPKGSTFDPVHQVCEIVLPGGQIIIISKPFQGPTGGTVVALTVARKKYHSACLYGPGPQYAIVGTNHNDRINGTHQAERILGLKGNDRLAGQSGSDCIDGGDGVDRIWSGNGKLIRDYGGNGNDRISVQNGNAHAWGGNGDDRMFFGNGNVRAWGGSGNDRISVGRGRDKIWGGSGNDQLAAGDGDDMVDGGSGNDKIWVGNGKDHVYGDAGNDRLYGRGEVIYDNCGSGSDIAYVNSFGINYAVRHGCERISPVRVHPLH